MHPSCKTYGLNPNPAFKCKDLGRQINKPIFKEFDLYIKDSHAVTQSDLWFQLPITHGLKTAEIVIVIS